MKYSFFILVLFIIGCGHEQQQSLQKQLIEVEEEVEIYEEVWAQRAVNICVVDSLIHGKSYLSVYSQMFNFSQHQKFNLTGMISLRNVSDQDTIYLLRADYYNTSGKKIRTYFDYSIEVLPMETLEIVIAKKDVEGGTGSNFVFEWKTPVDCPEPLFEGVMNSIQGNQGVSFTTHARRIF